MKVLVTDGANRAALAVTRSLGKAGHEVIVGERYAPSLAQTSRYCTGRVIYPDPSSAPEFVPFLADFVRASKIDVLLPVADITTFQITGNRQSFEPHCSIPFAVADVIERAANKVDLLETARRLGVPVPRSLVVHAADRIPHAEIQYPVVIKPWRSRLWTSEGWKSSAVSYARDASQLRRDLLSRPAYQFPVMLQERIVGPGIGVFACYHDGKPVAMFSHRRLRERPPWGGVSVLSESIALCPRASDYATRLLGDLGWRGVAMVEFKQDVRDGLPKLMEINGRFWGSLQLAIDAGVDFPALLVRSVSDGSFQPQAPYRLGTRNRWFWGDVDSLLLSLFATGNPGAARPARLEAVLEFMKLWGRDLHYDNPKRHDVRPWLFESVRWFRASLHGLQSTGKGRST